MSEENKKQYNSGKDVKTLRTYTSDMADAIRTNETSVIKIALAEKEKREQEMMYQQAEGTKTSKVVLIVGGVILIIAALVGSYFLFQKKKDRETPAPVVSTIDTFITYDAYSYLDVTNATNVNELLGIMRTNESEYSGLIKALFLTKKIGETNELTTAKNFFSIIKSSAPSSLIRSLADNYLLGKYSNQDSASPNDQQAMFLIFQVSDYNQVYASMLEWERTMLKDLFPLFNINIPGGDKTFFEKPWQDIIINNRDARVINGENGEGILYYVFVNKNHFVISNNLETIREVISRLIIKNTRPL